MIDRITDNMCYSQDRMRAAAWILWGSFLSSWVQPVYELWRQYKSVFTHGTRQVLFITHWYCSTEVTHCFGPGTLQKVHEGCLKSWKGENIIDFLLYLFYNSNYRGQQNILENVTKTKCSPHVEVLLLLGLEKEAFVAVFDFTHLGTKLIFSYAVMHVII